MICVGINVAKDKHDCFIMSSEGEVLADVFTVPNAGADAGEKSVDTGIFNQVFEYRRN